MQQCSNAVRTAVIMHITRPSAADFAAALATGFAVELRQDGSARYIAQGEHDIELDALGDRLLDALPIEGGVRRHRARTAGLPPIEWPLTNTYQEQP